MGGNYEGYVQCPSCEVDLLFVNDREIPSTGIEVACPNVTKCGKLKRNYRGNWYYSQYIFKVIPEKADS